MARLGTTRRGSFPSPYEQVIRLDFIALHPEYVDSGFINDIALLRLEKPVTFSDYVRPICLPVSEPRSGTTCTVTGWGQLFEIGRIFRKMIIVLLSHYYLLYVQSCKVESVKLRGMVRKIEKT